MRSLALALALVSLTMGARANAGKERPGTWQVMRATDPITRASTCVVAATDYVRKMRFTMSGALYPVVEMNSTYGLLVGVSSGGRIRLPTGDIIWAVDEQPYRVIRVAEIPGAIAPPGAGPDGSKTVEAVTAYALQLARSGVATSTMASGAKAREMFDEMLQGRSLLFRAAGLGPQTGLPEYSRLAAGQINENGQVNPIPLDQSFRDGLRSCSITT